jgi:N-acetylglucosamine-6-phosphate deacetylase
MRFTLRGAHLVDVVTEIPAGDITVEGTCIQAIGQGNDQPGTLIDVSGMIIMPGFIDVHTHGGGGFNLHTTSVEEISAYTSWVPTTGVTSYLIGVVGMPGALPEVQLATAAQAVEQRAAGAEALGIHLEGPYISVERRGAHLPSWLRMPDEAETERVLELTRGHLKLITLAPELPGASVMIRRLLDAGVTVSMGHTDVDYEQAQEAIALGITHMTHCFNAMRSVHHRYPGPLAAVAEAQQVLGEMIADGVHIHPSVMNLLVRMLGPERTVVITDALAAAGVPDAIFEFAGQEARVICGAARLSDGTLTGSVLTMEQALRNVLQFTKVSLQQAVGMLTFNPARAARVAERKGRLQTGYDADLLIFDPALTLQATICRGRVVFATERGRECLRELEDLESEGNLL